MVVGLVLVALSALLSVQTIRANGRDCGNALSPTKPSGGFYGPNTQALAEHACAGKVRGHREVAGVMFLAGVGLALWGVLDRESERRPAP